MPLKRLGCNNLACPRLKSISLSIENAGTETRKQGDILESEHNEKTKKWGKPLAFPSISSHFK